MMTHKKALWLMLICTLLWSTAGVVTRHLESARGFEVAFLRSAFAALSVVAYLAWTHGTQVLVQWREGGKSVWVSGLMWGIMFTCFMLAMTMTRVANVLITQSLAPIMTALLASWVLRHPVGLRTWGVVLVAAIGIACMYAFDIAGLGGRQIYGVLVALGVPIAAAINWITLKRAGQNLDLTASVLLGALFSMAITLPLALPFQASAHDVLLMALLGVFQLGVPCIMAVRAARDLSAPEVSLLALLEVIFGILLAWAFADERPGTATLLGGSLVIAALVYNEWARNRPSRLPAVET
jgi:drug/metabolite transporter (DMT)-like permease